MLGEAEKFNLEVTKVRSMIKKVLRNWELFFLKKGTSGYLIFIRDEKEMEKPRDENNAM